MKRERFTEGCMCLVKAISAVGPTGEGKAPESGHRAPGGAGPPIPHHLCLLLQSMLPAAGYFSPVTACPLPISMQVWFE